MNYDINDILHTYRDIHPDTSHGPQFDQVLDTILGTPSPFFIPGWLGPNGPRKWQFSVQLGHGGCSLDVRSCGALISASESEKNLVMPSEAIVTKQPKKGTHRNTTLYRKNHF